LHFIVVECYHMQPSAFRERERVRVKERARVRGGQGPRRQQGREVSQEV